MAAGGKWVRSPPSPPILSIMYYKDLETDKQAMRDYNQRMKENAASRRAKRADGKRK